MAAAEPVILIPSRMESERFPGKPLAPIGGIPMVIYCARNAMATGYNTYICTDSDLISEAARQYGIKSILTPRFATGTDRVNWAGKEIGAEYIINLQGDEPLIQPEAIRRMGEEVVQAHDTKKTIFNGVINLENELAYDPNNVKAVVRLNKTICYLSRKAIRNTNKPGSFIYTKQLGLYAFHKNALDHYARLDQSPLELAEKIEMLRWIDYGYDLNAVYSETQSISVDTPEDLSEVKEALGITEKI